MTSAASTSASSRKSYGSDAVTGGVRVRALPSYMADQSEPAHRRFLFAYRITIENNSDKTVQLLARHWVIIDANGRREDVEGPGVVGATPTLAPGESHTYSSFCPLETPWGTMEGEFQMRDEHGSLFEARIARFVLTSLVNA
jgi:ApaG protein